MSKAFKIAPGRYHHSKIGFLDATKEVSDEKAFSVYKIRRAAFPWIKLGPEALSFLKKQKLTVKEIAALVHNAVSKDEVELLLELTTSKTVHRIGEIKISSIDADAKPTN